MKTVKTITPEWLKKEEACKEGVEWFKASGLSSTAEVLKELLKEGKISDIQWVIGHTLNKKDAVKLAVFSARLCLPEYEKKYPDDASPRKAIEAAEAYLGNPCRKTKNAAGIAAWSAEWSAARSAAGIAARSAAGIAARSAARNAAEAARNAAEAAGSAAWSTAGSAAWSAAWEEIIEYSVSIYEEAAKPQEEKR